MSTALKPTIVRVEASFGDDTPEPAIKRLIAETDARAAARAKAEGITRPHVSKSFDLDVACAFTDYPMYLLGPDAPRLDTWRDVFVHYPRCRYTVVIRDQDYLDSLP